MSSTDPPDSFDERTHGLLRIESAPLALPAGLRDLLPPRSRRRRAIARAVLEHFERYGYQYVALPAFEREAVIARGMDDAARSTLVRFLEPDSGEVVVLRPDMTPQIARIAATRFRGVRGPLRFMYEGSVVRRPRGRARRERQTSQAGIECLGWSETAADVEILRAACGALETLGLRDWKIELGHAGVAAAILADVPEPLRAHVREALSSRDASTLARLLGSSFHAASPIAAALELHGDTDVIDVAARHPSLSALARAVATLREIVDSLARAGLGDKVLVDFADARGFGYYTGPTFQLLAPGVGEPLGAGGRYDDLLGRFGAPRAATGCALDLEHVEAALGAEPIDGDIAPRRAIVAGAESRRAPVADRLRTAGWAVSECGDASIAEVVGFARDGEYDLALFAAGDGVYRVDVERGGLAEERFEA